MLGAAGAALLLASLAGADPHCQAEVVRMGNKVAVCRMEVYAGPGPWLGEEEAPLVATGQGVYNILRNEEG